MANRIVKAFKNAITKKKQRGWDRIYVFVDIHETVLKPTWDKENLPNEFYRNSLLALKILSDRSDIRLVMYTSSTPKDIDYYVRILKSHGIHMDFINKNPEVVTNGYGDYSDKPYMNVILDDKAGFLPRKDWTKILRYLEKDAKI